MTIDNDGKFFLEPKDRTAKNLNDLVQKCHNASLKAGWWHDLDHINPNIIPTKIALIHSEISEAMEGHRRNKQDDHLPHRKAMEVELADAIIRICDLAGWMNYDLGGAVAEKLAYNAKRDDHKLEARAKDGGKAY